jgi:hypothetical protein
MDKIVDEYRSSLLSRYWNYINNSSVNQNRYLEISKKLEKRPPVYKREESWRNIITNPNGKKEEIDQLRQLIPEYKHHKWFRSMNSSQALAQSILGNMVISGYLYRLNEIEDDDDGRPLLENQNIKRNEYSMEHKILYLGESKRKTSLDAFISGNIKIAIECKFTEAEVGPCSRPGLTEKNTNYEKEKCDGNYSIQRNRKKRCSLTELGIKYWEYIPKLFTWKDNEDIIPCPVNENYQLVRNILSIGVDIDGRLSDKQGYALLIYDERNPAFQPNGKGYKSFYLTRKALINPSMLRKCSWQKVVNYLRINNNLPWLTDQLSLKYGL